MLFGCWLTMPLPHNYDSSVYGQQPGEPKSQGQPSGGLGLERHVLSSRQGTECGVKAGGL